jgi:hypothetical protein
MSFGATGTVCPALRVMRAASVAIELRKIGSCHWPATIPSTAAKKYEPGKRLLTVNEPSRVVNAVFKNLDVGNHC